MSPEEYTIPRYSTNTVPKHITEVKITKVQNMPYTDGT